MALIDISKIAGRKPVVVGTDRSAEIIKLIEGDTINLSEFHSLSGKEEKLKSLCTDIYRYCLDKTRALYDESYLRDSLLSVGVDHNLFIVNLASYALPIIIEGEGIHYQSKSLDADDIIGIVKSMVNENTNVDYDFFLGYVYGDEETYEEEYGEPRPDYLDENIMDILIEIIKNNVDVESFLKEFNKVLAIDVYSYAEEKLAEEKFYVHAMIGLDSSDREVYNQVLNPIPDDVWRDVSKRTYVVYYMIASELFNLFSNTKDYDEFSGRLSDIVSDNDDFRESHKRSISIYGNEAVETVYSFLLSKSRDLNEKNYEEMRDFFKEDGQASLNFLKSIDDGAKLFSANSDDAYAYVRIFSKEGKTTISIVEDEMSDLEYYRDEDNMYHIDKILRMMKLILTKDGDGYHQLSIPSKDSKVYVEINPNMPLLVTCTLEACLNPRMDDDNKSITNGEYVGEIFVDADIKYYLGISVRWLKHGFNRY